MRRLDLQDNGGIPIVLDDIDWLTGGVIEALKSILDLCGDAQKKGVALSGMEVTYSNFNYNWTDGYIYMNGEIYKVDAGNIQGQTGVGLGYYYNINNTYDVTGDKVMKNGTQTSTYKIMKVEVKFGTPPTGQDYFSLDILPRIETVIQNNIGLKYTYQWFSGTKSQFFDVNGKGLEGYGLKGWALCNGNNGTLNLNTQSGGSGINAPDTSMYWIQKIQ